MNFSLFDFCKCATSRPPQISCCVDAQVPLFSYSLVAYLKKFVYTCTSPRDQTAEIVIIRKRPSHDTFRAFQFYGGPFVLEIGSLLLNSVISRPTEEWSFRFWPFIGLESTCEKPIFTMRWSLFSDADRNGSYFAPLGSSFFPRVGHTHAKRLFVRAVHRLTAQQEGKQKTRIHAKAHLLCAEELANGTSRRVNSERGVNRVGLPAHRGVEMAIWIREWIQRD